MTTRSEVADEVAPWLRALECVVPTPPADYQPLVAWPDALDILRSDARVLEALVDHGLHCERSSSGELRFDYYDLVNVGLYSGSGRSLPEMGQSFALRFAGHSQTADEWVRPRRWQFGAQLRCVRRAVCGGGQWWLRRPDPEHFGGCLPEWPMARDAGDGRLCVSGVERVALMGQLETGGAVQHVRAPAIRELFEGMLTDLEGGRYRFQWLPPALRTDPGRAVANGTLDCVAIALLLARQAAALGRESRTRKGWILGLLPVEHGWVEVRDDDGEWKVIDPLLALLAVRVGGPNPAFTDFCLGSSTSQVLPFACGAEQRLAGHRCQINGASEDQPEIAGSVRPIRARNAKDSNHPEGGTS